MKPNLSFFEKLEELGVDITSKIPLGSVRIDRKLISGDLILTNGFI